MSNHLTYFKIENFKKFDSLEVKDIGQFNLITGDNNVGKTCLLEALLFDEDPKQLISNFYLALTKRGLKFQIEEVTTRIRNLSETETIYPKENYFGHYILKNKSTNCNIDYIINNENKFARIYLSKKEIIKNFIATEKIDYTNKNIIFDDYVNQFISFDRRSQNFENESNHYVDNYWIYSYDEDMLKFPLISFNSTPLNEETIKLYAALKTKTGKESLLNVLRVIDKTITDIEQRENFEDLKSVFLLSFDNKEEFVPLNFLGDGFKRIFYIALKVLSLKGKMILIDEIDIGIGVHHTKMKEFWVNLMNLCVRLDVQLFATTHSKECAQAYVEASKELDENIQKELRLIELYERKSKIFAGIVKEIDGIEYSVQYEPFRGEDIYA